jgi:hypothetical protein
MRVCEYNEKDCFLRWWFTVIFKFVRVMRPFSKFKVAVFMAFFLVILLLAPILARNVLGVKEDDWALYTVETLWSSEIPGDTVPQYLADINHTQWRMQVESVLDTESVRLSVTKYYRNGTEMSVEIHEGSVTTDSGNLSTWIIRKNLEVHDALYVGKDITVNATELHEFAGATRSTVYAGFAQEEGTSGNTTGRYGLFWDRDTGIFCGGVSTTIRTVEDKYLSMIVIRTNIFETSLWEPSDYTSWFLGIAVIIIIIVVVVVVFAWKRGKSKQRKTRKRST